MEDKINWYDYANSEIEIKLKTLEFEYEKLKQDVVKQYDLLNKLNNEYLRGKSVLERRIKPKK
jgi:hypothetical protein